VSLAQRAVTAYAQTASGLLLVLGALALLRDQFTGFVDSEGVSILWTTASPLMSLVHVAAGVAGVVMARTVAGARRYAWIVGVAGLVLGALEPILGDGDADILGRDTTMALVHLVVGVSGVAVALWSRADAAGAPAASR
jgi:hypothetical protein